MFVVDSSCRGGVLGVGFGGDAVGARRGCGRVAVGRRGTVVPDAELPSGTHLARFGYPGGAWLSPEATPFAELALPPGSALKPYFEYVVVDDPTKLPPGFHIEQSQVAPWFHQPGGGIQYRVIGPDGADAPVQALIDSGFLKDLYE
jgi:hypothetical protein